MQLWYGRPSRSQIIRRGRQHQFVHHPGIACVVTHIPITFIRIAITTVQAKQFFDSAGERVEYAINAIVLLGFPAFFARAVIINNSTQVTTKQAAAIAAQGGSGRAKRDASSGDASQESVPQQA